MANDSHWLIVWLLIGWLLTYDLDEWCDVRASKTNCLPVAYCGPIRCYNTPPTTTYVPGFVTHVALANQIDSSQLTNQDAWAFVMDLTF